MKPNSSAFSRSYLDAMRAHLGRRGPHPEGAEELAGQARANGITTLELAKLHKHLLLTEVLPDIPPGSRLPVVKRAASFFAAVLLPEDPAAPDRRNNLRCGRIIALLSQRMTELASSKLRLSHEVSRLKAAGHSLKSREAHSAKALVETSLLKDRSQAFSRQMLSVQEDERGKISRDLHDVVAQSLMSINVRLATLRKQAGLNARDFHRNIAATQRVLEKAALIVHRFASALRPPVLDDLGLIPALKSLMKEFGMRTGTATELKVCNGAEQLDPARRTAVFRVAQEALTNVESHARAGSVRLTILQAGENMVMTLHDDGRGFSLRRVLAACGNRYLGLLGMRERVEMVGGVFRIDSACGRGTTLTLEMPMGRIRKGAKTVH
jgi:signal transduction histidine kinase